MTRSHFTQNPSGLQPPILHQRAITLKQEHATEARQPQNYRIHTPGRNYRLTVEDSVASMVHRDSLLYHLLLLLCDWYIFLNRA